jgi:hypothetical protein
VCECACEECEKSTCVMKRGVGQREKMREAKDVYFRDSYHNRLPATTAITTTYHLHLGWMTSLHPSIHPHAPIGL